MTPFRPGRGFQAGGLLRRAAVALAVLAPTLFVSVVWQKMVYTIPVLAVLLFFAAGTSAGAGPTRRNIDEGATGHDAG